ncbi:quinone oxidoreductase family protein [Magnetovibrio blakemorei]|uniref:Quinone oxidoreductase n=1 Tax=Magnetovibrio blakemorei TaxID=28181 RepID=A0A1E5Q3W1_9PROT|nr:quinone oxidoreductase [Magnetovibrio blakemorei]OEJ64128.1 quinone oxidoreductase [Magnetovibrio blakemorei]
MTQTCKAIRVYAYGGPEVLSYEDVDVGTPQDGQIRVRHTAIGLNYIDIYMRTGLYPLTLPSPIGMEGAGIVEELGPNVTDLKVGDRVAYASQPPGSYAEQRLIAADRVVKIPDAIPDETAATMMLQGLTAQYLLRQTYVVQPGDTILMHAAAGGVGLIVCQWAKHLGATVIGTVGSAKKAELAKAHGCHHTILYQQENFKDRVLELTNGQGVNVVYDSIGKDTFMNSLECLKKRGTLVTFGNSSGPVPAFEPALLGKKGSLYLTRPTLFDYINTRENLSKMAAELFDIVASGTVKIEVNQRYALKDVAQAHVDLEARKTTGSTVIVP